ncbi:MAG: LPS assembly lipoprotein LptE [Porticoccus sp.]|jgi:outer membrane lipopolysaccharide assembly protein LptE/RlpB
MKKLIPVIISGFLVSLMITSCGWHLRSSGHTAALAAINQIHIDGDQKNQLYRFVSRSLKSSNIAITENSKEAEITIRLINQRSISRSASVNSSARVSELHITELVDVEIVTADGKVLLPKTTLSREKFFNYNEGNVSTNAEEQKILKREMMNDLARKIINILNSMLTKTSQYATES